jgi:hypothetical protein
MIGPESPVLFQTPWKGTSLCRRSAGIFERGSATRSIEKAAASGLRAAR